MPRKKITKSAQMLAMLLFIVSAMAFSQKSATTDPVEQLRRLFVTEPQDTIPSLLSFDEKLAIDAGESAISFLEETLKDNSSSRRLEAAYLAALIGGEKSRDVLKNEYNSSGDSQIGEYLCIAMGSTGSEEDRDFLVRVLTASDRKHRVTGAMHVNAVLSLFILRTPDAIAALKQSGKANPESWDSYAVKLLSAKVEDPVWKATTVHQDVITAMFRNGIPRTDEAKMFYESKTNLVWKKLDSTWHVEKADDATPKLPKISFDIHVSKDRAVAAVGVIFDGKNAEYFKYALRKPANTWKVTGILISGEA